MSAMCCTSMSKMIVVQSVECGGRCLSLGFKEIFVPLSPNSSETSFLLRKRDWYTTRSRFFGVHMENERSQHTLWIRMTGVCWAHCLSLQTTQLTIIMLFVIHRENLLTFKVKRVLSLRLMGDRIDFLFWWRNAKGDCQSNVTIYEIKLAKIYLTKQNKECPSIPLCTYHNLPYLVTQ